MQGRLDWSQSGEVSQEVQEIVTKVLKLHQCDNSETNFDIYNDDAMFQDPLGIAKGIGEIKAQFYGLSKMCVKSETKAFQAKLVEDAHERRIEVALIQEYTLRVIAKPVTIRSVLVLHLNEQGKVVFHEDRWNNNPHHDIRVPFIGLGHHIFRRLNGISTYMLYKTLTPSGRQVAVAPRRGLIRKAFHLWFTATKTGIMLVPVVARDLLQLGPYGTLRQYKRLAIDYADSHGAKEVRETVVERGVKGAAQHYAEAAIEKAEEHPAVREARERARKHGLPKAALLCAVSAAQAVDRKITSLTERTTLPKFVYSTTKSVAARFATVIPPQLVKIAQE